MTTVEIHADQYHAIVTLEKLPELPIVNIRKLFRIMFQAAWENPQSILSTTDWLKCTIREAGIEWHTASTEYEHKHASLPGYAVPTAESIKALARLSTNRPLIAAMKRAKARYERLMKIQSIFNETKEKYYA